MFLQAYDCQLYLKKLSLNYSALSDSYVRLDEKHKELRKDCTLELREKDTQIDQIVEGGIITAIILILVL